MAGQPTHFENYPLEGERVAVSDPVAIPGLVTPYRSDPRLPPPSPPAGLGRRGLITLFVGVPVAGALAAWVMGAGGDEDDPGETGDGPYLTVGEDEEYGAALPEGWDVSTTEEGATVLVNGDNRLVALATSEDGSQSIGGQLTELTEKHRGRFQGRLGEPLDTSSATARRVTLTGAGTYGGAAARLRADLWLDPGGNGLLVLQALTAGKGSTIAKDAQAVANELSAGF